jgi:hypothetical protein
MTRSRATAALLGCVLAILAATAPLTPTSRASDRWLPFSTASGEVVQRQPQPRKCHAKGSGLYSLPDPRCTSGALNPAVSPKTIDSTICRSGWTAAVRPPEPITEREKLLSMDAYGDGARPSAYEYDHLVPLELGGAVNDRRNLWPEPDYPVPAGFYRNPKDRLEGILKRLVCRRAMPLASAQRLIANDWVLALRRYD